MSTKPNWKAYRLAKQVDQSKWEEHEYGVKPIRAGSYEDVLNYLFMYEHPDRSDFWSRSWKRNRKTQYKGG